MVPPPHRRRPVLHAVLFLATVCTTTVAGALHYASFIADFGRQAVDLDWIPLILHGLPFSISLLSILGAHELGHYLACRYYRVDATLPFFIPAPIPLTGTLGAVIRIRGIFPSRAVLFDIAVAGPIGGFVVLLPVLYLGLHWSTVVVFPDQFDGVSLGEPPLFRLATRLIWGTIPDGYSLNIHPMVFAAWFGLFATAANLLPFGQLDGGHVSYAALGDRSRFVSFVTVLTAVALTAYSTSWLLVTVMMLIMLFMMGPRHPRVLDESVPLDPARQAIAILMIVMFIACFTPSLIEPYALLPR